jgi:hypothetical protein
VAFVLVLVAISAALLLSGNASTPARKRAVLLWGDSLAEGLAGPFLATATDEAARSSWRVKAQRGATLPASVPLAGGPWDLVLATFGTNDAAGRIPPELFAQRALAARLAVEGQGGRLVWLFPPRMPFDMTLYADALTSAGVRVVTAPDGLPRAPDQIHVTQAGNRLWWGSAGPRALGAP